MQSGPDFGTFLPAELSASLILLVIGTSTRTIPYASLAACPKAFSSIVRTRATRIGRGPYIVPGFLPLTRQSDDRRLGRLYGAGEGWPKRLSRCRQGGPNHARPEQPECISRSSIQIHISTSIGRCRFRPAVNTGIQRSERARPRVGRAQAAVRTIRSRTSIASRAWARHARRTAAALGRGDQLGGGCEEQAPYEFEQDRMQMLTKRTVRDRIFRTRVLKASTGAARSPASNLSMAAAGLRSKQLISNRFRKEGLTLCRTASPCQAPCIGCLIEGCCPWPMTSGFCSQITSTT